MTSILVSLRVRLARFRRRRRAEWIRSRYVANLDEVERSLEDRVEFHLSHLDDFWSRCVGFLEAAKRVRPAFLAADWTLCPLVASRVARPDINAFCKAHSAGEFQAAWQSYEAALEGLRSGRPSVEQAVRRGEEAFTRVLAVGMRPSRPAI